MKITVTLPEYNAERPETTLTPREAEALKYVTMGWTNAAIADVMKVSYDYAKWLITQCMNKIGCDNRVQLAVWFMTQVKYSELEETRRELVKISFELITLKRVMRHLQK